MKLSPNTRLSWAYRMFLLKLALFPGYEARVRAANKRDLPLIRRSDGGTEVILYGDLAGKGDKELK